MRKTKKRRWYTVDGKLHYDGFACAITTSRNSVRHGLTYECPHCGEEHTTTTFIGRVGTGTRPPDPYLYTPCGTIDPPNADGHRRIEDGGGVAFITRKSYQERMQTVRPLELEASARRLALGRRRVEEKKKHERLTIRVQLGPDQLEAAESMGLDPRTWVERMLDAASKARLGKGG